ncbi:MAG: response regulator transcription factor [Candidatus Omnitrophica bacterium]|nr:response regulator transcription factor [Candidatus Omnitrophota bacterium]
MMTEGKKKILILDDEEDICEILKVRLSKFGFDVVIAHTSEKGYEVAVQERPALVLLDVWLKDGDEGLSFIRKLRSFRHDDPDEEDKVRRTPIIMLTNAGETMKSLFEVEGISDYIEKPFDANDVKERIDKVLSRG